MTRSERLQKLVQSGVKLEGITLGKTVPAKKTRSKKRPKKGPKKK